MSKKKLYKYETASYVIEHEVAPSKEVEFRKWQSSITKAASHFAGYIGTDVCPPIDDDNKWYIVVQFDVCDNLHHWLESDVRQELIDVGKTIFSTAKITHFKTGLERWFVKQEAQPTAWKQVMATLLGLYPTVMILSMGQAALPWTKSWQFADVMLISNLLSCCVLTWLVMPFVAWLLKAWLQPKKNLTHIHWVGAVMILVGLALMRSLFVLVT